MRYDVTPHENNLAQKAYSSHVYHFHHKEQYMSLTYPVCPNNVLITPHENNLVQKAYTSRMYHFHHNSHYMSLTYPVCPNNAA